MDHLNERVLKSCSFMDFFFRGDEDLVDAFHWSFRLLAQLLVRPKQLAATGYEYSVVLLPGPSNKEPHWSCEPSIPTVDRRLGPPG